MTRTMTIALSVAALTAVGAAGAVAHRYQHDGPGWGHHDRHFGIMGPMGALCRGNGAEMADHMLVRIEHRVKPTEAQKPSFEELRTTLAAAAAKIEAACPPPPAKTADGEFTPKPPTERLAEAETSLAATLDAVRTVRPVADKFYATLDDAQKKAFTEMGPGCKHGGAASLRPTMTAGKTIDSGRQQGPRRRNVGARAAPDLPAAKDG